MLISGGDDTKLFAYSAREFTKFSPHDICPVPQRPHIQLAVNTIFNQAALLLIQASYWIDVLLVRAVSGGAAKTDLVARVKCKAPRKITCSAVSPSGGLFAFSDHVKCCLFELKRIASSKSPWAVNKSHLPLDLPFAHSMVFSADSSRLMIAGCDRRVYVSTLSSLPSSLLFSTVLLNRSKMDILSLTAHLSCRELACHLLFGFTKKFIVVSFSIGIDKQRF